jgi:hypothetical protein
LERREVGRKVNKRMRETVICWSSGYHSKVGRAGRRREVNKEPDNLDNQNVLNNPYKLYDTETRLQRVCGQLS